MATKQELLDKRAATWAKAQEFNERAKAGDELSGEDETAWRSAIADVDALTEQIETRERSEKLDARFAEIDETTRTGTDAGRPATGDRTGSNGGDDKYREAFVGFLRYGLEGVDAEARQMLQANFSIGEQRAQSAGTNNTGGYTVPAGFWAKVTDTMKFYGGVLNVVEVLNTETGNPLSWPTADDTSNSGAILAENTQISAQDITFGQKTLGAYTYTSKLILASLQFLQDTGIDAESYIARKIGERLGRIHNAHFTTGTGSSQPTGFITGATTGKTAASATAITVDEIIDLEHSVDVAYRGNGSFQLNDLVLAYVRKLKDSQGRYLWEPSQQAGQPDLLHGYRYTVNNDMDSAITTGKKTIAFGDFRAGYVARIARQMQLMRLTERYADYLQVGFFGFDRADGLVQDASAFKILVQA